MCLSATHALSVSLDIKGQVNSHSSHVLVKNILLALVQPMPAYTDPETCWRGLHGEHPGRPALIVNNPTEPTRSIRDITTSSHVPSLGRASVAVYVKPGQVILRQSLSRGNRTDILLTQTSCIQSVLEALLIKINGLKIIPCLRIVSACEMNRAT